MINIWEETAWAGFFQTRLEARHNIVVAVVVFTGGLAWWPGTGSIAGYGARTRYVR